MGSTRARILAEATRQLATVGYPTFTMASVRDAVGVSSGSMFHAFSSKPALAAAVYVGGMAEYQAAALAAIAATRQPDRAVRAWIRSHLGWVEDRKDLARYLFSTQPDEVMSEAAGPLAKHNEAFYAALDDLFERAAAAGFAGRLPGPLAQAICIGPAQEYARRWTRDQVEARPREVSRMLENAALAALSATRKEKRR